MLRLATNDRERESSRRALVLADSIEPRVYIRATCDGVVATRSVMEGEYVAEHTELLSIVDLSSMVFQAEVPIGNAGSLRLRLPAIVALSQFDGDGLPAVVDGILPQADGESQSITVRLRFTGLTAEQNRKIKVNVQGTAEITTGCHRGVMLVDRNAVLHDDATHRSSIVLMTKDSLAHTVDVDQGLANDSLAEVSGAGLRAGMAVIRDGNYALAESTRVTLVRP